LNNNIEELITNIENNDYISEEVDLDSNSIDIDRDTLANEIDNCPYIYNRDQKDSDKDGLGDVCDENPEKDSDKDGIPDETDNCLNIYNPDQKDTNNNSQGDACSEKMKDHDKDGIDDRIDNCPYSFNPEQKDLNRNGQGDICEKNWEDFFEEDTTEEKLVFTIAPTARTDIENNIITINWETNIETEAAIRYGFEEDSLNLYKSSLKKEKKHSIKIELEEKKEKLFYSISSLSSEQKIESDILSIKIEIEEKEIINKSDNIEEKYQTILLEKLNKESKILEEKIVTTIILLFLIISAIFTLTTWHGLHDLFDSLKHIFKKD